MALLLTKLTYPLQFRSLQSGIQQIPFEIMMPETEARRGYRFTPEVMQGARLIFCAAVSCGRFKVKLPDADITFPQAGLSRGEISLFLSLPDDASQRYRLGKLKALRPDIVRALFRQDWSSPSTGKIPVSPRYYAGLPPELRPENFLPELREAMQRFHTWMDMAWMNGLEGKVAETALAILKDTRLPLPESMVASAVAKAQPADYPMLQHHARNALPHFQLDADFHGLPPGKVLWQRLKALPGFDWRTVARDRWQRAFQNARGTAAVQTDLRNAAVLAGDSDAFNQLLEMKVATGYDGEIDWKELDPLIDGLPSEEPARKAWLLENAGKFLWDNAAGKYRQAPKNP